jgi:hypothetical protein
VLDTRNSELQALTLTANIDLGDVLLYRNLPHLPCGDKADRERTLKLPPNDQ